VFSSGPSEEHDSGPGSRTYRGPDAHVVRSRVKGTIALLAAAARAYIDDRAIRLGAGLAYYSLFALIPILTLAVSMASIFFGQELVTGEFYARINEILGADAAGLITDAVESMSLETGDAVLPAASLVVMVFTGTLLFVAWREVVNIIWGVPRERGIAATIEKRLFALAAVLGSSLLITTILFAQTVLGLFSNRLDLAVFDGLLLVTGSFLPLAIGALFLAVLYKYTPTAEIAWGDVWLASLVAIILLSAGSWAYGLYIGVAGLGSPVGVAGTVFLGLALVYYAAQILLYGIEIVKEKNRQRLGAGWSGK
jgi:membrane protein